MSYVTLAVDGKVGSNDVSAPARVLCGGTGETRNCGQRLLAMLDGNEQGRVDLGYEWQLVPIGEPASEPTASPSPVSRRPAGRLPGIDADLQAFIDTFASSPMQKLGRACRNGGITSLAQMAALDEDTFLAIEGLGHTTLAKLRKFVAAREQAPPAPSAEPEPDGEIMYDVLPPRREEGINRYRVRRGYRVFMPNNLYSGFLHDKGIRTVEDLRAAVADDSIYQVCGAGPRTVARIVLALEQHAGVTA